MGVVKVVSDCTSNFHSSFYSNTFAWSISVSINWNNTCCWAVCGLNHLNARLRCRSAAALQLRRFCPPSFIQSSLVGVNGARLLFTFFDSGQGYAFPTVSSSACSCVCVCVFVCVCMMITRKAVDGFRGYAELIFGTTAIRALRILDPYTHDGRDAVSCRVKDV